MQESKLDITCTCAILIGVEFFNSFGRGKVNAIKAYTEKY
jgi:hypothetical protein